MQGFIFGEVYSSTKYTCMNRALCVLSGSLEAHITFHRRNLLERGTKRNQPWVPTMITLLNSVSLVVPYYILYLDQSADNF